MNSSILRYSFQDRPSTNWTLDIFNDVKWFTSCVAECMQLEDDAMLEPIEEVDYR